MDEELESIAMEDNYYQLLNISKTVNITLNFSTITYLIFYPTKII